MNLTTICGHTFDESLLPERAVILDVGSRNFDFTRGILALRPKARVIALDPDPAIHPMQHPNVTFLRYALVGDGRTRSNYASYSTGEGNMLLDGDSYYDAKILRVDCMDIGYLMNCCNVYRFDLIKLDCEGSEFGILENWPPLITIRDKMASDSHDVHSQLSIEFHDGTPNGPNRDEAYYQKLFAKLGYRVIQHEVSKQGDWIGHWDTLLA